ncbi:DinB family protein [Paenibacillus soyae]|uniref:DinB family protein n=1 Tax=Paenibacillus soyae TaxID=2969249 RepID=A0A9X2MUB5_9BACL|nr:DinB family protein [Paenibacillus soyae]MCR2806650.1 DinB family protein [Paenibacillus soyae]
MEQRRVVWNENHKRLTELLSKPSEHENATRLLLAHHASLHSSKLVDEDIFSFEDSLVEGLEEAAWRLYPMKTPDTKNSIAWHVWHIARIEDMTMNALVTNGQQVLTSGSWLQDLNVRFAHSGNSMIDDDIAELSAKLDIGALLAYRYAVGKQTRRILASLQPGDWTQKVQADRIQRLFEEQALLPEASGIGDYWSNKTIAGLALMPATRHNFVHLNKCDRIKQKLQKTQKKPVR